MERCCAHDDISVRHEQSSETVGLVDPITFMETAYPLQNTRKSTILCQLKKTRGPVYFKPFVIQNTRQLDRKTRKMRLQAYWHKAENAVEKFISCLSFSTREYIG